MFRQALKGRKPTVALSPFQGLRMMDRISQGVALGYFPLPLWGKETSITYVDTNARQFALPTPRRHLARGVTASRKTMTGTSAHLFNRR
jgi:hypothetical protein